MVRIGLIGAGYMGARHAAAYRATPGATIAAVAGGSTGASASRLGAALGLRPVADWRSILDDPRLDAVDVTFPTSLHRTVVESALAAGKHVFCETPLAPVPEDAAEMVRAARRSGRLLQVALLPRFDRARGIVRDLVRAGRLGRLHALRGRRLAPGTGGAHHGDAIEEILLFELDSCEWILGHPRLAFARATRGQSGRIDHVTALLDYGTTAACVEGSYLLPREHGFEAGLDVYGEAGCVETSLRDAPPGPPQSRVAVYLRGEPPAIDETVGEDPVVAECRHFVRVVEGEASPELLDAEQARLALEVVAAIRRSIESGAAEQVREPRVERGRPSTATHDEDPTGRAD